MLRIKNRRRVRGRGDAVTKEVLMHVGGNPKGCPHKIEWRRLAPEPADQRSAPPTNYERLLEQAIRVARNPNCKLTAIEIVDKVLNH